MFDYPPPRPLMSQFHIQQILGFGPDSLPPFGTMSFFLKASLTFFLAAIAALYIKVHVILLLCCRFLYSTTIRFNNLFLWNSSIYLLLHYVGCIWGIILWWMIHIMPDEYHINFSILRLVCHKDFKLYGANALNAG